MPPPKINRCVILYDLNSRNQPQLRRALLKIYSYYYFRESKDLVNLVLVNCEKTKNRKYQKLGKGYVNIFELNHEELLYHPTFAHENIELKNAETSNWKEALAVAVQILKEDKTAVQILKEDKTQKQKHRIITYQILYLTDLSCSSNSTENIDDIILDLNENNIFLNIVGPEVKYPKTITSFEEVRPLLQAISFNRANKSLVEAAGLVQRCNNAIIADVKMGLQFFFNYKNPIGKQIWAQPLTVGSKIKYSVGSTKLMERSKGFKLKRKNQVSSSSIFVSALDSNKTFAPEDVRKGILKHEKFIPLDNNDMFEVKVDKMFSLVFITKIKYIPEYMMKGPGCYTVAAARKSPSAAFNSLLLRLDEAKSCVIAKRVYSKGDIPLYLALLPVPSKKCFRAVQLPYGSEVPFDWMEEEPQKYKEDVSEEVVDFLESLNVDSKKFSLNCPMTPNVISSSKGENLANLATQKLLHEPNLRLEEVEYDPFSTGINPEVGKNLRDVWPSRRPAKTKDEVKGEDEESDNDANDYFQE